MSACRHPGGLELTRRMAALCGWHEGAHILDACCGEGVTSCLLMDEFNLNPVGIDIDPGTIRAAREACPGGVFIEGDACRLPFEDGRFDGAVSECCLGLMKDARLALAEIFRVLKPGGRVMISDLYDKNGGASGLGGEQELAALWAETGFKTYEWQDCPDVLAQYAGQRIFEVGREQFLRECALIDMTGESSTLGYYFAILQK